MTEPYIENREGDECPFGFVYFDDTRIGFSNVKGNPPFWSSRGWGTPTPRQFTQARELVLKEFPNFLNPTKKDASK